MEFTLRPAAKINSHSNRPVVLHATVKGSTTPLVGKVVYTALRGEVVLESGLFHFPHDKRLSIVVTGFEAIPHLVNVLRAELVVFNALGERISTKTKLVLTRTNKSLEWLGFTTYSLLCVYTRIPDYDWKTVLPELID